MKNKTPVNKEGQRHGYCEQYHTNGKLCHKGLFFNGKLYGFHEDYFYFGELCYRGRFFNNERYGYHEEYGKPENIITYYGR